MKIIFINDRFPPATCGIGHYALSLAKKLRQQGNEMIVITSTQDKQCEGVEYINEIKVYKIYSNFHRIFNNYFVIYNYQTIDKIRKIFQKERPDISHFFNLHEYISFYALKISKQYSKVTFWHARDTMSFSYGKISHFVNDGMEYADIKKEIYKLFFINHLKRARKTFNPFRNYLIRHYLNYADHILSVSYALKDAMEINGIHRDIKVIYSGINLREYNFNENELADFKKNLRIKDEKILFFSGRLSYRKGATQAVLALERILSARKDVILLIAGNQGECIENLLRYAEDKKFAEHIVFTGWLSRDEIKKAYLISDVVLSLSLYLDALPKVNIEAMAAKKPVIGTCFGGTPEIIEDNKTGFIVNPLKIDKVAEKILYLLNNHGISMQFGNEGYKRVREKFNLDNITTEILDLYSKHL